MQIHKEGYSLLKNTGLGLLLLNLGSIVTLPRRATLSLMVSSLATYGFLMAFFRRPVRYTPDCRNCVISPADGLVVDIRHVQEDEFFGDERIAISIFLSVFNVHMNWVPVNGRVVYSEYHPGQYLVAMHPKSSELNERHTVVIETPELGPILVRQIAGLLARRISCYTERGQAVKAGQELGFIKFGSRVDIFLPRTSQINVERYQTVRGGETVLAEL